MSDAPEIASVDAEGTVTALAVGEATVTASVGSDISASCRVTVVGPAAESLTLNAAALTLTIGEQSQLTATPLARGCQSGGPCVELVGQRRGLG